MKVSAKKWFCWGIVGIVCMVLLMVWQRSESPQKPVLLNLSDNTQIRVLSLRFGLNPNVTAWQRFVSHLPAKIRPYKFIPPSTYVAGQKPALVMFYEDQPTRPNPSYELSFGLADDSGFELVSDRFQRWPNLNPNHVPRHFEFVNFPRRSKSLKLRVYSVSRPSFSNEFLGEALLRNPFHSSAKSWPDQGLPASQRSGDTTFRLKDALFESSGNPDQNRMLLKLQFIGNQTTNKDWRATTVRVLDASGNEFFVEHPVTRQAADGCEVLLNRSLWPAEALRFQIGLERQEGFPAGERLVLEKIPVPGADGYTLIGLTTNLAGHTLVVDGLSANTANPPWQRNASITATNLDCHFLPSTGQVGTAVIKLLGAVDDKGRLIPEMKSNVYGAYAASQLIARQESYGLKLYPDSKTVTLQVAIQRRIAVEYTVKPRPALTHLNWK